MASEALRDDRDVALQAVRNSNFNEGFEKDINVMLPLRDASARLRGDPETRKLSKLGRRVCVLH
jgi:hypothetical protein